MDQNFIHRMSHSPKLYSSAPILSEHCLSPAGEDGCECTVSNYTHITNLLNRPLSRAHCTFIGWASTATLNQPISCMANTRKWHHSSETCHKCVENRWGPNAFQMSLDSSWTQFSLYCKNLWGKNNRPIKQHFGTPLWRMSAGHKETPRDTTCQSGAVVFFSNPLMSGE